MADDLAPSLPEGLQLTALDAGYREDPYSRLRAVREACPVRRDSLFGSVFLSRYADVRGVLTDLSLWRDPMKGDERSLAKRRQMAEEAQAGRARIQSILTSDDPDHGRVRGLITPVFYKRVAASKAMVERVVRERLDGLEGRDRFDLIADYAIPIPIEVIAHLLGVDETRLEEFRGWSEAIIHTFNPGRTPEQTQELQTAAEASMAYLAELLAQRRAEPRDDLVSDLARLQGEGAELSDEEIRINCNTLLIAGNLTTTDLIGNAVRLLLTHPDQLARLKAEPSLISGVVEEVLRYEPPVDSTARVASHALEIGGVAVEAREALTASLRAANRDPEAFPEPDRFDIARARAPHVAFGGGAHICLGAPLARIEAQAALAALIARFPDLSLEDGEPQWRALPFFRGLEVLGVRTGRA